MLSERVIYLSIATFFLLFVIAYLWLRLPPVLRRLKLGRAWRNAFPKVRERDITEFLALLGDALQMPARRRLGLRPADTLYEVYRRLYPKRVLPDTEQLEVLADALYAAYGLDLADFWSDRLSLGELFAAAYRELRRRH